MPSSRFAATLVKKEVTYAVDPTPGTSDGVRLREPLWGLMRPRMIFESRNDDLANNSLVGHKIGQPAGAVMDIEMPWHARGKGSAYSNADTDIEANPLLQACGLSSTLDATGGAEKITFGLAEGAHASAAMYGYAGSDRAKVFGMRGNLRWPINAGEQGRLMLAMTGLFSTNPDAQAVPSASYDSPDAPVAVGCGFTLNPGSPYIPQWTMGEFNLGNQPEVIEDANGTDGLAGVEIVHRVNPQFTCTIRKDALATYNPRNLYKLRTSHLIDLTLGNTQYNRIKLDVDESYQSKEPESVILRGLDYWKLTFDVKQVLVVFT